MTDAAVLEAMLLRNRILEKSIPIPEAGCWLWLGALFQSGYGDLTKRYPVRRAHRASWVAFHGAIPDGMNVLHRCDVRSCVNPYHLFLGSHRANQEDKTAKNRQAKGTNHGRARLAEQEVLAIRCSTETNKALSCLYGVGASQIQRIRDRKSWAWL